MVVFIFLCHETFPRKHVRNSFQLPPLSRVSRYHSYRASLSNMAAKSSKFRERKLSRTNLAGVQAIARRERKKVSEAFKFNLLINEKLRFLKVLKNFTDES